jgi:mannosyltransferase
MLAARRLTLASETTTGGSRSRALGRPRSGLRSDAAMAVGLTLLAAVIRLPTLAEQSFWLDEGYTERLVRMSLTGMLHTIPRTESTPPLYYALAWLWTRVFGYSELGLRSLSAVAGIATIPVAWAIARRLSGPRAAAIAGLLLAVSPLMVWFSQEARSYALATLLSTISVLCVVGWQQERRGAWLIGWAVSAALGLATHYFVAFVVAPELVLLWWRAPRTDRRLTAASVLVLAAAAALVPLALAQRGTGHADYIAQGSLGTRVLQVPKQLLVGYASPGQLVTAVLAAASLLAGAVWPLARAAAIRRRALTPLVVGVTGVLLPVALALVGVDFLDTRNLLPVLPVLAVAAAVGFAACDGWRRGRVLAAAVVVVSLAVVVLVDVSPRYQRDDWRGAARALGAPALTRAIVVSPGSGVIPLQLYLPSLRTLTTPTAVRELDIVAIPVQVTGSGIAAPPRPSAPLPVPAGFRLFRAVYAGTYTVLRYRSPTPARLAPAALGADHLGSSGYLPLVQRNGVAR